MRGFVGYTLSFKPHGRGRAPKWLKVPTPGEQQDAIKRYIHSQPLVKGMSRTDMLIRMYSDFVDFKKPELKRFRDAVEKCRAEDAVLLVSSIEVVAGYMPLNVEIAKLTLLPKLATPYMDKLNPLDDVPGQSFDDFCHLLDEAKEKDNKYQKRLLRRPNFKSPLRPIQVRLVTNNKDDPVVIFDQNTQMLMSMLRHGYVLGYGLKSGQIRKGLRKSCKRSGLANEQRRYSHLSSCSPEYQERREKDESRIARAGQVLSDHADARARELEPLLMVILADGHKTLREIEREILMRTEGRIRVPHTTVGNYLKRLGLR